MKGKIIKGIAGFYYVHVEGKGVYACRAKGIFRNVQIRPLVGDDVCISVLDETKKEGSVTQILPRKNELLRPAVANIDQALILFAITRPEPNLNLLDRFLIRMERQNLPCMICFNKADLLPKEEADTRQQAAFSRETLIKAYQTGGYPVLFFSALMREGIEEVEAAVRGKTTVLAGPSGVGKSTLINCLAPEAAMATGSISEKIKRGKHTTRHSEIIALGEETYLMDTPGFTSLQIPEISKEELGACYPEFAAHEPYCRFGGCAHIDEPDCGIKAAVECGQISRIRYDSYRMLYRELKEARKY